MASDGPTPAPCNLEIYSKGECILTLSGSSNMVERWVKSVATEANARVDWHYVGGVAVVKHLGDEASLLRTYKAIARLLPQFGGQVVNQFDRVRRYERLKREMEK